MNDLHAMKPFYTSYRVSTAILPMPEASARQPIGACI